MRSSVLPTLLLSFALLGAASGGAQSPQVTSERPCDEDSDCPHHEGCWFDWWPGCGCNEGAGHCDPNPQPCDAANQCFGEEFCSSTGRCTEPGPPPGTGCNSDDECASWMSCIEGRCSRGECVDNGDCATNFACDRNQCRRIACSRDTDCVGGEVCREGECRRVACVSDDECGARAICSDGACRAVECRNAGQCPSCSLCGSDNRCVSLCRDGEICFGFPSAEPGRFIVHLCTGRSDLTCTSRASCPLGHQCLGGNCVDLRGLQRDLDLRLREKP